MSASFYRAFEYHKRGGSWLVFDKGICIGTARTAGPGQRWEATQGDHVVGRYRSREKAAIGLRDARVPV